MLTAMLLGIWELDYLRSLPFRVIKGNKPSDAEKAAQTRRWRWHYILLALGFVMLVAAAVVAFLRETGSLPQNVNWAVKADFARPLFDAPDAQPPLRQRGDAINRAKRALCQVEAQP